MDFLSAVLLLVISVGLCIYSAAGGDVLLFAIGSISGVIAARELWDMRQPGDCE